MEMLALLFTIHTCIAESNCTELWPKERAEFRDFFYLLNSCYAGFNRASDIDLSHALRATETVTLPRKDWKVPKRVYSTNSLGLQAMMLRVLVQTTYLSLADTVDQAPQLRFPVSIVKQIYVIVTVGPREQGVLIISFTGWDEGQTWNEFLGEIPSIMLGQLARNVSMIPGNKEIYIVGFYGHCIYITLGFFAADIIFLVHSKACSDDETFALKFTRGYNLSLKKDWLEAIHALTRLLRYLLSGGRMVTA
ncbi:hypothetical protein BDV29DRAFT_198857 [Aspergillus leporis]|uniref:Fungal-type protein kinase domain-containing protein n=1 Tax=Aspergillus leporis TaxID=41062 RepID=A0A5N5WLQ3_9EURO|nr:hypothetical protein BDV29DRAFT_198857 [Aspergillus leporis]